MKENLQNIIEQLNKPINALSDSLGKFAMLEKFVEAMLADVEKDQANG